MVIERVRDMQCKIVDDFFGLMTSLREEQRVPRDYGDGNQFYHSEVELLDTIKRNPQMNVSDLSVHCGVTKSAITQMCNKLIDKAVLEKYSVGKNKKEKFFRLTEQGELVYDGFVKYHAEANRNIQEYLCALNAQDKSVLVGFFSKVRENMPMCAFSCACGTSDNDFCKVHE